MKNFKELILLIIFTVITYCYYPKANKEIISKKTETSIINDYAQAYMYCMELRYKKK